MEAPLGWEYCALKLQGWQEKRGLWFYSLRIQYFGERGGQYTLSEMEGKNAKDWKYNPWERAFGLLGVAGWELVNVIHGNHIPGNQASGGYLLGDNAVAYFKRPIISVRRVDEPKLVLN